MANSGRKPILTCLLVVLVVSVLCICGIIILGGGGYYLYTSGQYTINDVLNLVGRGPAEIQIVNLSDGDLYAELIYIDEETGETSHHTSLDLASYDISTMRDLSAGQFQLNLSTSLGVPEDGICWLNLRGGDIYRFVVVPDGVGVILSGEDVDSAEEVDIRTSSLCQP